jgi:hypothetical protein
VKAKEEGMIRLIDKDTGKYLGRITEEDLKFLQENLEEESTTDFDYYINSETLDLLKEKGMSADFAKLIEVAMGGSGEIEIGCQKE